MCALKFIGERNGKIFCVHFVKRTTGDNRAMLCRQGVKKHLAGGELPYNAKEHGLIPVYDMQKEGYRMIPTEGIFEIEIDKVWHKVM